MLDKCPACCSSPGFSAGPCITAQHCALLQDRKWQLKAADEVEWQQWLAQQKQAANITADTVYVQVGGSTHNGCGLPAMLQMQALPAAAAAASSPCRPAGHPPGRLVPQQEPATPCTRNLHHDVNPPLQIQLDGSVRASGSGIPPWQRFVDDLPELDSVRTKLTDGVGLS